MVDANSIEPFWQEFMLKVFAHTQPAMIFRGVPDKQYELLPSIARHPAEYTGGDVEMLERELIEEFKRLSLRELEFEPQNAFEWLFLAQHHGLPTRLLDWSTNPLVALYFAVEKNDESDGLLYMTSQAVSDQYDLFDYRTADYLNPVPIAIQTHQRVVLFVRPKYKDRRYHNQASVFSCPAQPYTALTRDVLKNLDTIVVPCRLKPYLRERLRTLGISASFIYPGLDGITSEVKSLRFDPVRNGHRRLFSFKSVLNFGAATEPAGDTPHGQTP